MVLSRPGYTPIQNVPCIILSVIVKSQLGKINEFLEKRKNNFQYLMERLRNLSHVLILPQKTSNSDPAWFGFPITVREDAPFTKNELVEFLTTKLIDTRPMFAGNIIKQPYFKNKKYRICGDLTITDRIMHGTFWIGVYPGLDKTMLDYVCDQIENFVKMQKSYSNNTT